MGVLDKFLDAMRLNSDDEEDDFYEEDYFEDDDPTITNIRSHKARKSSTEYEEPASGREKTKQSGKITQMRPKKAGTNGMEVCVIKPTTVDDAREITETLLSNRTVILNVEGLDIEIAQRIIDFTAGSCFAINGKLQKISNYIIIASPSSVDISGDFLNMVDSAKLTGLYADLADL